MAETYTNVSSHEGQVSGQVTVPLRFRVRRISITNDHSSADLKFKFNASSDWSTLRGLEQISLKIMVRQVILQGNSVDYRILGVG